jgi:phenylalanyl-tRNA synthetase beta chain
VAREVAALLGKRAHRPEASLTPGARDAAGLTSVTVLDVAGCPRYTARLIEGVAVGPAPRWMRRRLEAVGVRPISNLVDVSNYVMFELGQPLHAFDADKLHGGIRVRRAQAGETLVTLDGQMRVLEASDLLICDEERPVALAGVMGGADTEVTAATTRVLLEAATFLPTAVRRTARRLALPSEASHRFERGVDAAGVDFASARAARLMAEHAGGTVARGLVDACTAAPAPRVLALRPERARMLLGIDLSTEEMARCLRALELAAEPGAGGLAVTIPSTRADLEREVDLIEEIARVHGLDDVPATLPPLRVAPEPRPPSVALRARAALIAAGLDEAQTFGFTSSARIAALRLPPEHPASQPIAVANPMREDQAVMRTSLLANLLPALGRNLAFGQADVRLFEVGHVFLPSTQMGAVLPDEPLFVAGVLAGERPGWLKPGGAVDFTDAKGVVERLLDGLGVKARYTPARSEAGFLHPGVAAAILCSEGHVGVVGEVHPETRAALGLEAPCFAFEICLDLLPVSGRVAFQPFPRVPGILRDISFFVDESVAAARVEQVVGDARPELLESFRVLEDYREAGKVPAGKKGMLWSFTYRGGDRTLTDAEVDAAHEALVTHLLAALRAERR